MGNKNNDSHVCIHCSKSFKQRQSLYRHKKNCSSLGKFSCLKCKKSFSRKDVMRNSVICKGNTASVSVCVLCAGKQFKTNWHLKRHIKQAHLGRS